MLLTTDDCYSRIVTLSLGDLYHGASKLERTGWIKRNIPNPETLDQHQIGAALMITQQFKREVEKLQINILATQDTLLIHDLAEPDHRVGDITPHCGISHEAKREIEEKVIREILSDKPYLLKLWLDYEDGRTPEGRFAMEIDKLQAIEKARYYEDLHGIPGLTEEFFTYSVIKKNQIYTDFLVRYAIDLQENKPR
ncbi:HD domain-containing protein [Candidatus Gracilibacteria bacterium]|nr:HD domain-containing protein [Candidatus Gracilibacteria bacterium]